jgi:hypothetical protein
VIKAIVGWLLFLIAAVCLCFGAIVAALLIWYGVASWLA